jgi:hypothetical protein
VRHTGVLEMRPVVLNWARLDVTIKPDGDCRPVLALSPRTEEEEAALFRAHEGKLRFEGLSFLLRPANGRFKAQAVVAALGEPACTFQDCVFTMQEAADVRQAVVVLPDAPGASPPSTSRATFGFHNCFVRGNGDLVAARVPRPIDLQADNTLVALSGSLLHREATDNAPAPPADAFDSLRLQHVTAFLTGNLAYLRARDSSLLLPLKFRSVSDCLFVAGSPSTNPQTSLIQLNGPEVSDERLKTLLGWEQGQHNAYTDFGALIDPKPDNGAMMMPYGSVKWKEFTRETDAVFDRVKMENKPGPEVLLSAVTPARFRVKPDEMRGPDMQGYGADLDQLPKAAAPADAATTPDEE